MLGRPTRAGAGPLLAMLLLADALVARALAATSTDPAAALDAAIAAAETSLREGELQTAESHYRSALLEGWLLTGALEAAEGRLPEAREAFRRASTSAVETRRALQSLALVQMQMGEAAEAVGILTRVVGRNPKDGRLRHLLAQALTASGQPEQAAQELEEAGAAAPDDLELAFLLATDYLRLKKPEAAERLLARIAKERPGAQTQVLIGRVYRDYGEYDRARASLTTALELDPRAKRAHNYLGMVAVLEQGAAGLDEAIREFREELKLGPKDPLTNLRLGMALVEARRPEEALPALEIAALSEPPTADVFHYLGRALLALDRPAEAVAPLRRALALARRESQIGSIHYQLALVLRQLGDTEQAAQHFAEAERYSAERAASLRERLNRYLAGDVEAEAEALATPWVEGDALAALTPARRADLRRRVTTALARAYLNLGVMQAQAERFPRAAELLEEAARVDPEFPQVQYSLGVARFNARQYDKAVAPLARALAKSPGDPGLERMLALASFNAEDYAKALELLRDDPERDTNASLQYAYGLALVRSGRAAEAQAIFSRLLALHGDSAELNVVLGQAYAQEGDYDSARKALSLALRLEPRVAEASATLGVIYLKQGRLPEAEAALRAELREHPADVRSQHNLATVLDLEGRPEESLPLLRSALKAKPDFADARYLLGKVLLAQGAAPEALEHLEAAVRLAPQDANIHYQLAQAYQKLGRTERAEQEFEAFRRIKDERRGAAP